MSIIHRLGRSLFDLLTPILPRGLSRRLMFAMRYRQGDLPWDTGQTPPEVVDYVGSVAPGRALDLGCGTGTNVLYLAEQGWEADGVDFVGQAVTQAKEKLSSRGLTGRFFQGDVTQLEALPLRPPYDLLLDIGCMHSLDGTGRSHYAASLARLAAPGAAFLLYAGLPRQRGPIQIGITPEEVTRLFAPDFTVEHLDLGDDSGAGWPRAWYRLRRSASAPGGPAV